MKNRRKLTGYEEVVVELGQGDEFGALSLAVAARARFVGFDAGEAAGFDGAAGAAVLPRV